MSRLGPFLLLGGTGCLYLDTFLSPFTPIYQGDTAPIYLLEAVKMLEGQVMYRDFFQFTLPGTQVFYLLLFRLFGVRAWIPAAAWVALGIGLAWLTAQVSKSLLKAPYVYLPSLLFLGFGFVSEPDPTHHWFSTLACMGAVALLIARRSPPRLASAGALCGLAALFTQSRGLVALLGFGAYLLWEWHAKKQTGRWLIKGGACLAAPFLAVILPTVTYFVWKVGVARFFTCTVVFLARYWSKWYWGTFDVYMADPPSYPFPMEVPVLLVWLFIHALVPFVYLWFLVRYRRQSRTHPEEPWDHLMLVNMLGIFLFLGIAFSPVWFRLISVAPPALILFAWLVKSSPRLPRAVPALIAAFALAILVGQSVMVQTGWKGYLLAPTGSAALLDRDRFEKYEWVLNRTHPKEFYFEADDCDQYFLLDLRDPAQVSFVTESSYTRPDQVQNVIESLEKYKVRWVMWSPWLDVPRTRGADGRTLTPLRAYLRAHYHPVKEFADDLEEALERDR